MADLELWGGIECTINRVGDAWFNQLERTGHAGRPADLELIASLGLRVLRYPAPWELAAPDGPAPLNWSWADERLPRLQRLGIEPIVGLVHHGSGPRWTHLLDREFAPALARYAGEFAARFPWVRRYTPVNEPLTTARFSGLYGHWYPHARDDRSFARALVNQCRAVALSMRAIRAVNPAAELVQTDDLGTTYATPRLQYQADFDNERRWLSWDLLAGRVDARHPLRSFLEACGIAAAELEEFVDAPCPPQVVGINHYVTSDRFLDETLAAYPPAAHGSNGRERYADVDAVRVLRGSYHGWRVLDAAWQRYRRPLAVTEVHLGCTREEQIRWLEDAWCAARAARARGIELLAVTAWALFGSCDWDSLLTRQRGHYEPGAFDVRGPEPRPTALAERLRALASGRGAAPTAVPIGPRGWWQRPEKLHYESHAAAGPAVIGLGSAHKSHGQARPRPLLVCGAGALGHALALACIQRGLEVRLLPRAELDICDPRAIELRLASLEPWGLINAAGYTRIDEAEREPARCLLENATGARLLAEATAARGLRFLTFSSDFVFDGCADTPYLESSPVAPLNAYGRSQAAAEAATLAAHPPSLCVRSAALFGGTPRGDFLLEALRSLACGARPGTIDDVVISPTYVPDLAHAALDLLLDGCRGLWHLVNPGAISRSGLVRRAATLCGLDPEGVDARPLESFGLRAARPRYAVLGSERGLLLPPLEEALERFCRGAPAASVRGLKRARAAGAG